MSNESEMKITLHIDVNESLLNKIVKEVSERGIQMDDFIRKTLEDTVNPSGDDWCSSYSDCY